MLQTSLVQLLFDGTAKIKLAVLALVCCIEFVKNPVVTRNLPGDRSTCSSWEKVVIFLLRHVCTEIYMWHKQDRTTGLVSTSLRYRSDSNQGSDYIVIFHSLMVSNILTFSEELFFPSRSIFWISMMLRTKN